MEYTQFENKGTQRSAAFVIARDALIFLMLILILILIYVVSPQTLSAAPVVTKNASLYTDVQSESVSSSISPQSSPSQASPTLPVNAMIAEYTPSPSPLPTPSPTPYDPIANGDFSSVFPQVDTGADAFLSYQGDSLKIAIDKIQENGVTYFVADVWVKTIDVFHTALAKGTYGRGFHEMPLKIANDNQAIFAVSGDYYGAREQGVVVRDGVLYRDAMSDDVCILKTDGTLSVYRKSGFSALGMLGSTVWQVWAFGPVLVENGVVCDTSDSKIKVKNPRSAIGYYEPGHYCFIVVDGRQDGYSNGMTLDELAHAFASRGCTTAYNLDGGATAMMVFQGALVNHPVSGGRSSSDIIYF